MPKIYKDPQLKKYIDSSFGGLVDVQMTIITDFCRHAFDGSGARNTFRCLEIQLTET